MFRKVITLLLFIGLSSCASNNAEVLDPKSPYYGKAYFTYNNNDLSIIELNKKPFSGWDGWLDNFGEYVETRFNSVLFRFNYDKEKFYRCFIARPGETIHLTYYPSGHIRRPSYTFSLFTSLRPGIDPILDYVNVPCKDEKEYKLRSTKTQET